MYGSGPSILVGLGWVGFSNKIFQFLVYNVVTDSRSRLLANKLVAVQLGFEMG